MTHPTRSHLARSVSTGTFSAWLENRFRAAPLALLTGVCLLGSGCAGTGPKVANDVTESYTIPKYDSYADRPVKPAGAQLNLSYGMLQEQRGQFAEARASYEKVLKESPKSAEAMAGIGRLDLAAGRVLDAERHFKDALKADPNSAVALAQLGQFYVEQGRSSEGIALLTQAMSAAPDDKTYRYNLAVALTRSGFVDQAVPHFARSVGEAEGHYNIGVILHEQGDVAGCEREMRLALSQNPELAEARSWLADLGAEGSGDNLSLIANQGPANSPPPRPLNGSGNQPLKPVIRVRSATQTQTAAVAVAPQAAKPVRTVNTSGQRTLQVTRNDENLPSNGLQISPSATSAFKPLNRATPQPWNGTEGTQWQPLPTASGTARTTAPVETPQNLQSGSDSDFSSEPAAATAMPRWDQRGSSSSFN